MSNAEVAEILEETAQLTEDTLDLLESQLNEVRTVVQNNPYLIAGAFVVGAGIGAVVAYKIAVKRTTLKYEDILVEQLADARDFYQRLAKDGPFATPESAVQELIPDAVVEAAADALTSYQGGGEPVPYNRPEEVVIEEPAPVIVEKVEKVEVNVFTETRGSAAPAWDYDREHKIREENPDVPYVISFDEYLENPERHEQTTLAYFAQDDTLVDEREQPIDNTDYTVGDDNLLRFGEGSNDPNVVYIRNERLGVDFEVVASRGSYHKEVFGTEKDELKHSARRTRPRNRGLDE